MVSTIKGWQDMNSNRRSFRSELTSLIIAECALLVSILALCQTMDIFKHILVTAYVAISGVVFLIILIKIIVLYIKLARK